MSFAVPCTENLCWNALEVDILESRWMDAELTQVPEVMEVVSALWEGDRLKVPKDSSSAERLISDRIALPWRKHVFFMCKVDPYKLETTSEQI